MSGDDKVYAGERSLFNISGGSYVGAVNDAAKMYGSADGSSSRSQMYTDAEAAAAPQANSLFTGAAPAAGNVAGTQSLFNAAPAAATGAGAGAGAAAPSLFSAQSGTSADLAHETQDDIVYLMKRTATNTRLVKDLSQTVQPTDKAVTVPIGSNAKLGQFLKGPYASDPETYKIYGSKENHHPDRQFTVDGVSVASGRNNGETPIAVTLVSKGAKERRFTNGNTVNCNGDVMGQVFHASSTLEELTPNQLSQDAYKTRTMWQKLHENENLDEATRDEARESMNWVEASAHLLTPMPLNVALKQCREGQFTNGLSSWVVPMTNPIAQLAEDAFHEEKKDNPHAELKTDSGTNYVLTTSQFDNAKNRLELMESVINSNTTSLANLHLEVGAAVPSGLYTTLVDQRARNPTSAEAARVAAESARVAAQSSQAAVQATNAAVDAINRAVKDKGSPSKEKGVASTVSRSHVTHRASDEKTKSSVSTQAAISLDIKMKDGRDYRRVAPEHLKNDPEFSKKVYAVSASRLSSFKKGSEMSAIHNVAM